MFKPARAMRWIFPIFALALSPGALVEASPQRAAVPQGTDKVAGTIVNSIDGAPLGRVRVSLTETTNQANAASVITTEDGHFEFHSVAAGKFSLRGAKRDFITAGYQQHEGFSTAIVTGAGLDTENLVLWLTPLALVSGRIIDEFGDPVRNANVKLYIETTWDGRKRVQLATATEKTDDLGTYEFPAMHPGKYYLAADAKPWYAMRTSSTTYGGAADARSNEAAWLDVAYPTTFYNGATDSDAATPIAVGAGERVTADLHLGPVPAIHLTIRYSPDDPRRYTFPQFQKRVFDSLESVELSGSSSNPAGEYELEGIPAGRYTITSRGLSGARFKMTEVNLENSDQELETSSTEPTGRVEVSLKMARGESLPGDLNLMLRDSQQKVVAYQGVENGEATFEDVPIGNYAILVNGQTPHTISRYTLQGVETAGHDITVAAGASLEVTAYVAAGVVKVEGFAKRDGKSMSGVMVALVPKDPQTHPERFRRDQTDMDGSFVVSAVLPGSYTIIAVEDAWGFPWMEPGALDRYVQHGQNITMGELMKGAVLLPDPIDVQPR